MRSMWTVVGFTLRTKMMNKAFVVSTVVLALILALGTNLPYIFSLFSSNEPTVIGLVQGNVTDVEKSFEQQFGKNTDYKVVSYPKSSQDQLDKDVESGKIEGYLTFEASAGGSKEFPKVVFRGKDKLDMGDERVIATVLTGIKSEFLVKDLLTPEQIKQLSVPVALESVTLAKDTATGQMKEEEKPDGAASFIVVFALIFLFFMTNQITGNMIAAEVTQEKSSRIMEILISSVSPLAQMFGKIIGMFILGLLQIVVFIAVIAVNLSLPHNIEPLKAIDIDISTIDPLVIIYGLLLYILGFFLYATLYASIGSIVSRTEDLAQAIAPITILSLAAFYIGIFCIGTPNAMIVKVTSFIPFFTPVSMLLRVGTGTVEWWEFWISIALLLAAVVLFGWLSAKIYRTGVLMYGKRPSWKEIRKAMKAYKI
ncbi:ABC transporter permease [Paenibacillus sp. 481]|uniref:ABC transporter permease n=1 Tax=Paenibacillus sp. 481 TaxID=2835869 RepID=UPI001E35F098|nr:ABC transporter permease [Paenibacillus sp. 481]UHA74999.1 ABC transporter permease [Paenibacillus sp. 481]